MPIPALSTTAERTPSVSRDIARHTSVYAVGEIISRFASLLMLPIYIRYLSPSDYGAIAILDVITNVLNIFIQSGMAGALSRYYQAANDEHERDRVWCSGFAFLVLSTATFALASYLGRHQLAQIAFGSDQEPWPYYIHLSVSTLSINCLSIVPQTRLLNLKRSTTAVSFSMVRLALNVALNLLFLVGFGMKVQGILFGNLATAAIMAIAYHTTWLSIIRRFAVDPVIIQSLWKFGSPLLINSLIQLAMHQADRIFLREFLSLSEVGVYSLAYQIGMAINAMAILPFDNIWNVSLYEIHRMPDARSHYLRVFRYNMLAVAMVMLGAAFSARAVVAVVAKPDYAQAAQFLPVLCLGFVFYNLHQHFKVPALVHQKTHLFIIVSTVAVIANILLNFLLIPTLGAKGAAWASAGTYAIYSLTGYAVYRRIEDYGYPLLQGAALLAAMCASFVIVQLIADSSSNWVYSLILGALVWLLWASFIWKITPVDIWRLLRHPSEVVELLKPKP